MAAQAPLREVRETPHVAIDRAKLRLERKLNGLNQRELGEAIGVSGGYIGHIESGRRPTVSPSVYVRLCDRLGLNRTELMVDRASDNCEQSKTVEANTQGIRAPRGA